MHSKENTNYSKGRELWYTTSLKVGNYKNTSQKGRCRQHVLRSPDSGSIYTPIYTFINFTGALISTIEKYKNIELHFLILPTCYKTELTTHHCIFFQRHFMLFKIYLSPQIYALIKNIENQIIQFIWRRSIIFHQQPLIIKQQTYNRLCNLCYLRFFKSIPSVYFHL